MLSCAVASRRFAVDQMVVSVGPYRFHSVVPGVVSFFSSQDGRASPPHSNFMPGAAIQPALVSIFQVAGVACMTVAPLLRINAINALASAAVSREAIVRQAPLSKGE